MRQHPRWNSLDLEIQVLFGNQRRQVQRHRAHHCPQVQHLRVAGLLAQLLYLGQRQHLVGQHGGALYRAVDFAQGLHRLHVAAQCRLHLDLEHRERRTQLVRCVAHEALLVFEQQVQACHHLVGRVHHGAQFARDAGRADGSQVALGPLVQTRAETAHRARGALHHHHHDQGDHAGQRGLAPEGVDQYLARQRAPQLQRFGHLDGGHATPAQAGHRLQQHGHPYCVAAPHVVIKIDQRGVRPLVRDAAMPGRQIAAAVHQLAAYIRDAVGHAAAVVGLERFQRGVGHTGLEARLRAFAFHLEQFADRLGRRQQRAVVGGVDGRQGLAVQRYRVHQHEQRDRHQDAEQQVAAQRQAGAGGGHLRPLP